MGTIFAEAQIVKKIVLVNITQTENLFLHMCRDGNVCVWCVCVFFHMCSDCSVVFHLLCHPTTFGFMISQ